MPARSAPQGISIHPQLQKMIEAYLSGQSAREIARWSNPQVGHTTISRYMSAKVAQAIANADALIRVAPRTDIANTPIGGQLEQVDRPQQVERQQVDHRRQQVERLATEALVASPVL